MRLVEIASSSLARSTMYKITKKKSKINGPRVELSIVEKGEYLSPFAAVNQAITLRRVWSEELQQPVKLRINGKTYTPFKAERWAQEEYRLLVKCQYCGVILCGEVFVHRLCDEGLFCTQKCADFSLNAALDKLNDCEEIEYL